MSWILRPGKRGLRLGGFLLVLACGLPLALSPAAAQAPNIIVNYDVLNSLADMPAGEAETRAAREGTAPSIFAVPESRLLFRPENKNSKRKSAAPARKATAPTQAIPLPQAKPPLSDALIAQEKAEASPSSVAPPASSSGPSPEKAEASESVDAPPAPETATAPLIALPVPPPPPEAPQLAEVTGSAAPAAAPAVEIPTLPESPAVELPALPESPAAPEAKSEVAKKSTAASEESGAPATTAAAQALSILFDAASVELSDAAKAALTELAQSLNEDADRKVELRGHAAGTGGNPRRTSLSRARAVRSFLVDKGVATTRIDVRPLGATSKGGPPDRVDIVDARR